MLISANLTPLAGTRFRRLLTRATMYPSLGALTGILAGIVTQSTNAVTTWTISMVSAGIIDKRRAMPIPIWAHVGASLLVMLVAVNLRIGASYIIALAGFAIYLGIDRADQVRHLIANLPRDRSPVPRDRDAEIRRPGHCAISSSAKGYSPRPARHPAILLVLGMGLNPSSANPQR